MDAWGIAALVVAVAIPVGGCAYLVGYFQGWDDGADHEANWK